MGIPLRIFIVEDSEDDALLLVRELQRGGYDVAFERVEAAGAMTAALDNRQWDIVLADYTMPHFSGTDALRLLRERELDIPFKMLNSMISQPGKFCCCFFLHTAYYPLSRKRGYKWAFPSGH